MAAGPRAALVAPAVLALAACNAILGSGATLQRDGSILRVTAPGNSDVAAANGWLCPADPGPGEIWSASGRTRLTEAGCLDLGANRQPAGAAQQYIGQVDLSSVSADGRAAFAGRGTWLLYVASGGEGFEHVWSAQVSAVSVAP